MTELPDGITRGDRARLFPILADRSIEGRTLSIFLATLIHVRPFAEKILGDLGKRIGPWAKLSAFTEVCFENEADHEGDRPDGLLIVDTGRSRWTLLVEAKVRKGEIGVDQLSRYLKVAKTNKIDAVLTLSNQFSLAPHHHPIAVNIPKGVDLFHLSWMRILTDAFLLLNQGFKNEDSFYVLNEFKRFISHDSAGVESFTQMPAVWSEITETVQAGGSILSSPAKELVEAWHQECQDLSLIFSRQIDAGVSKKLTRAESNDPNIRVSNDIEVLKQRQILSMELDVPNAISPVSVLIDLKRRTISISMHITAPGDRKRNSARLNWLLRQLPSEGIDGYFLRAQWPGRSPWTQIALAEAHTDSSPLYESKGTMDLVGFEVVKVVDLGSRFGRPRVFIDELEDAVPEFYETVGQNLQAWVQPAPRVKEERSDPDTVSPSSIAD